MPRGNLLYLRFLPVEVTEVAGAAYKQETVIDHLAGEAGSYRPFEPPAGDQDVGGIKHLS